MVDDGPMELTQITYDVVERIATITLDRPQARNAYTSTMADEIAAALVVADRDEDVRAVILTGAGGDFCVGADLSGGSFGDVSASGSTGGSTVGAGGGGVAAGGAGGDGVAAGGAGGGGRWQEPAGRVSRTIHAMSTPVIAAMRGAAVGGGLTITLSCDFRLGSTDSRFGLVFSRRGIYPEGGSVWYLPRLVGVTKAQDWLITGRLFDAEEALAAGLLTAVHPPEDVLPAARSLAEEIRDSTSPVSVAVIRQMLARLSGEVSPGPAHEVDSRLIAGLAHDPDALEGVASFLEKRPPDFPKTVAKDLPAHLPWV